MCGINGAWHSDKTINEDQFIAMRDSMRHRGPDDAGVWYNTSKNLGFGHRRLAFMDMSESGRQPMESEDDRIVVTVNGEIYNYQELKSELESKGYSFFSRSDSEVILYAWQQWHTGMLEKLNGMFAFALYDNKTDELLLARDRFGIKPLYYHHSDNRFLFASEIKAIISYAPDLKQIRPASLADFFTYRYIPSPYTIYQDIHKLEPATYLLKHGNKTKVNTYWSPPEPSSKTKTKRIPDELENLFRRSVKMHTQSELPVGSFLSGGYDSSAIVSALYDNNITANTYSIGFSNWKGSEDKYASMVAGHFNMPHFSKTSEHSHLDLLNQLMQHYDEPIADISILPTWLVSEMASEKNKAVLSGEGADELFGGYTWHHENIEKNRWKNRLKPGKTSPAPFSVEAYNQAMAMGHLRSNGLNNLLTSDYADSIPADSDWFYRKHAGGAPNADRFRRMDLRCFMSELVLTKVDRASMAHSLEVRVPFLENKLVDYMLSLPHQQVYKRGVQKYRLQQIIKNKLPQEILQRKKQGFVGPDRYYRNAKWYAGIISESELVADGIIRKSEIKHYLNNRMYWKLWKFAVLENWYKTWM